MGFLTNTWQMGREQPHIVVKRQFFLSCDAMVGAKAFFAYSKPVCALPNVGRHLNANA